MYAENLTKIPAVFSKREYNKAFSLIHDHPFQFGNAKIEQLKPGQTPNIHDYPPWFGNENDQAIMNKDTVLLRKESQDYYIKAVSAENDTLHQKFYRMVTIGNDIICKIQTLGRCLYICWVYYNQPNFENPSVRPSELFTQTALPDLSYVFKLFYKDVLLLEPYNLRVEGILYETKQSILDDTNTTMRCVLTFLAGWISGAEVDNLRNAYNDLVTIHNDSALLNLLRCLDAVGTRFASEEPKWELERNKPTKTSQPATEPKGKTSKKCHYIISQEKAAADLGVTRQTIIRWEKEQTEDGPNNTSNQFGYYRGLRNLPGPYDLFVKTFNAYNRTDQKKSFVEFIEEFHRHNIKM